MRTLPRLGEILNTTQLAEATAGGDNYIRTKDNVVLGLAYDPKDNPYAPTRPGQTGLIVFGNGRERTGRAKLFLSSKAVTPAFVKHGTNAWEYIGEYRAEKICTDTETIKKYCGDRDIGTQAGVLYIMPDDEPDVVVSGGGFANAETRKTIETAAIAFARRKLEQRGFLVESHERQNLGYDLFASGPGTLLVEVKGTNCPDPRFFITRKEMRLSKTHTGWRLFVVCNAQSTPVLHEFTGQEMAERFAFDALAWECSKKSI